MSNMSEVWFFKNLMKLLKKTERFRIEGNVSDLGELDDLS